jgi:hypothetical protein
MARLQLIVLFLSLFHFRLSSQQQQLPFGVIFDIRTPPGGVGSGQCSDDQINTLGVIWTDAWSLAISGLQLVQQCLADPQRLTRDGMLAQYIFFTQFGLARNVDYSSVECKLRLAHSFSLNALQRLDGSRSMFCTRTLTDEPYSLQLGSCSCCNG